MKSTHTINDAFHYLDISVIDCMVKPDGNKQEGIDAWNRREK